jgi:hypothetical protein
MFLANLHVCLFVFVCHFIKCNIENKIKELVRNFKYFVDKHYCKVRNYSEFCWQYTYIHIYHSRTTHARSTESPLRVLPQRRARRVQQAVVSWRLTIVLASPPGTVDKAICNLEQYSLKKKTLYPRMGSRGVSDIPPRRPSLTTFYTFY